MIFTGALCFFAVYMLKGVTEMKDELRISTPWMKGFIANTVKKIVRKRFGYSIDLDLDNIYVSTDEEGAHIHISANVDMDKPSFDKMLSEII